MRKLFIVAVSFVAPIAVALAADSWERDFAQGMTSTDTNVRFKAVTDLDPSIPKARDYLVNVLDKENWHIRGGAIDKLATLSGDGLEDLKTKLEKASSPYVREGIALAFGKSRDRINDSLPGLKDKHPMVRRAVTISLGLNPTKEGIAALIGALESEKDWDVRVFVRESLEKATGQFFGNSAQDWKNWWTQNQETWAPKEPVDPAKEAVDKAKGKTDEEKKAEEDGNKPKEETTSLRDVDLTFKESGKGGPLFVIPEMYRNGLYMEKNLSSLEDIARVAYIDLPEISKFKGLKNVGATGVPYYPLDKLADAFDELREMRKQERIAILGHGMAAWVAMRYATRHPRNVSHLILVSTWTSDKAWGNGRDRIEADGKSRKDPEQEHYAQSRVVDPNTGKHRYEPKDPQEDEALNRMDWTMYFADPRNSYCNLWYRTTHRDMGGCIIPDFDVGKEKGNPVPVLIICGTHPRSLWTNVQDLKLFQKYYPNSEVLQCPNSSFMPMIEDYDMFIKGVRAFFKKYPFKKAKA